MGLVLGRYPWFAGQVPGDRRTIADEVFQECITPVIETTTANELLHEIQRRLPLFIALHLRLLDEVAVPDVAEDLPTFSRGAYGALVDQIRRWAEPLDEVTRAELEVILATLNRSEELLMAAKAQQQNPRRGDLADLFRTAVLSEFLLFCLWRWVELEQRPATTAQLMYSLRYAVLDHAAAVRRLLGDSGKVASQRSSAPDGSEDSFWATAGTLPLLELGEAA